MREFDNALRRQAYSLSALIRQQYADLEPKTRKALSTQEIFSIKRIILTGCGDSHAAAMATRYTFEQLAGIPTEVVPAIELSRFYDERQLGFAPHNPLAIAISNSGDIARVCEAIQRVTKHGGFALAVTGNGSSLLGRSASRMIQMEVPPFESAPGTRSYIVAVLALLLLAIRFGEVKGQYTMDQAMSYRTDILQQAALLEDMLPRMDENMLTQAKCWKDMDGFDFIGAGQDYAAAWFGHAKVYEAIGKYAMCINTEEWLHLNFFMRLYDKVGTSLVCSGESPARSRAQELLRYAAKDVQRPTLLITDDAQGWELAGATCIVTPKSRFGFNTALTQYVPFCLLAGYIGEMIGEKDGRGCEGNWSFAKGGAGIKNSEIIVR